MIASVLAVGLGAAQLSRDPDAELVAFSLGSCVAICVWDPTGPIAAMAHVVLPDAPDHHPAGGKYGNQAVPYLVDLLRRAGGHPWRAQWKLAGGANVLRGTKLPPIGERNVQAIRAAMRAQGLTISAEETGGTVGRTIRLRVRDGVIQLRLAGGREHCL